MKLTLKQFVYAFLIIMCTLCAACGMALYTQGHQSVGLGLIVFLAVLVAFVLAVIGKPENTHSHE